MDHELKSTIGVIIALIIILSGIAFFLRDTGSPVQATATPGAQPTKDLSTTQSTSMNTQASSTQTPVTSATITTNFGPITFQFATNTPLTVANFAKLAQSGFYDGVRFHRVIKGFMIQAGDPLSKDVANKASWGTGGPGYRFNDELTGNEQYTLGTVAMANAGPNTNGSQFFIVTANPGVALPPNYTVFGHVTSGIETALKIQEVKTDASDRPTEDVIIQKVEVR